jgi:outer membrane receptor protein involved in Fe transport
MVDYIHSTTPARGFDKVRVPGDPERETLATRERDGIDIDDNHIPSRTYVDLDFSKFIGVNTEVYAKVNNAFNVDPPLAPNPITEPNYNGGFFHDRIGRYYKLGARFTF